jgi:hypothetical protein
VQRRHAARRRRPRSLLVNIDHHVGNCIRRGELVDAARRRAERWRPTPSTRSACWSQDIAANLLAISIDTGSFRQSDQRAHIRRVPAHRFDGVDLTRASPDLDSWRRPREARGVLLRPWAPSRFGGQPCSTWTTISAESHATMDDVRDL